MKKRDEDLSREVELLRSKYEELERLAKGQGLSGIFNFKRAADTEGAKSVKPARSSYKIYQINHNKKSLICNRGKISPLNSFDHWG